MKKDLFIVGPGLQGCSLVCGISIISLCAREVPPITGEVEQDHGFVL